MDVFEFYERLGKRCSEIQALGPEANCHLCVFRKFCYTIPSDVSPSFLQETQERLETYRTVED